MKAIKQEYQMYSGFLAEKWQMYAAFLIVLVIWHLHSYFRYRMNFQHKENAETESDLTAIEETVDDTIEIDVTIKIDDTIEIASEIDEVIDDSMFFTVEEEEVAMFKLKDVNANTYVSSNFQLVEFLSKDGAKITQQQLNNVAELSSILQRIRNFVNSGRPQKELRIFHLVRINSGCRSPKRNLEAGGAPLSTHIDCKAADFVIEGFTPAQTYRIVDYMIKTGEIPDGGLGLYKTHVHYDTGNPRRW